MADLYFCLAATLSSVGVGVIQLIVYNNKQFTPWLMVVFLYNSSRMLELSLVYFSVSCNLIFDIPCKCFRK